ncbi:MAG: hypothetical protein M0P31_18870, partial [Solirubrobacteraceae bacterium]|nr:hypothetical protein [Solirubrobacteraceae bacterium]
DTSGTTTIRRGSSPHVAPIDRQAVTVDPFDGDRRPTGSHRGRDHLDPVADPIVVDLFAPTDDELRLAARNEHRRRLEVGVILRREERRPGPLTLARLYRLAELADAAGRPVDARRWRGQATTIRSAGTRAYRHVIHRRRSGPEHPIDRDELRALVNAVPGMLTATESRLLASYLRLGTLEDAAKTLGLDLDAADLALRRTKAKIGAFLRDEDQQHASRAARTAESVALGRTNAARAPSRRPRQRGAGPRRSVRTVGRRASCGNGNGGSSGGSPGESDPEPPTPAGSVGRLSTHKPAQVVADRIGGAACSA